MLRVGIPPPYPPWVNDYGCFRRKNENGTILTFESEKRICVNNPGYSIALLLDLIRALGHRTFKNVTFVSADGWGLTDTGRGMVEMIGRSEIDMTTPDLAMTYERHKVVDYPRIVYSSPPHCFMVCGTSNLLRMSIWGILHKLIPTPYVLLFLFLTGFALWIGRQVQKNVERRSSGRIRNIFEIVCDVAMVRESDRTSVGLIHNYFVSSILFLVYMNGIFAGHLVETFAPKREFPFKSIEHLAEGVQHGHWRLRAPKGTAQAQELSRMKELKQAIKTTPIAWLKPPITPETIQSNDIVFDSHTFVNSFMKKFRYSSDCICDPVVSKAPVIFGSSGTSKFQKKLTKDLTNAVDILAARGILNSLRHKYFSNTGSHSVSSTQNILGTDFNIDMVPVEVSLEVFYIPFVIYCGFLLLSISVFLVEVLVKDNWLASLE